MSSTSGSKKIGIFVGFFLIVILGIWTALQFSHKKQSVSLKGVVGGEKLGLMQDDKVKDILQSRYGITLASVAKRGSVQMVDEENGQDDFLFPSQLETEMFRQQKSSMLKQSETILNSPLVIYSWDTVTDALVNSRVATSAGSGYYTVDLPLLIKMIGEGKKWSDIGVPSVYGSIAISTTDPNYSNSGAMFSGLLANLMLGEGNVAGPDSIEKVLPKLKEFYAKLGFMERSSFDLFESYLTTGQGAKPLVVGYENQMVEFALLKPEVWNKHKADVRVLYPIPTCWSVHQLLALDENAQALIPAMADPDIQRIAWERHGFRSGQSGSINDSKIMGSIGIPERIDKVVPLPSAATMSRILAALKQ